jgi:hypothetical protein
VRAGLEEDDIIESPPRPVRLPVLQKPRARRLPLAQQEDSMQRSDEILEASECSRPSACKGKITCREDRLKKVPWGSLPLPKTVLSVANMQRA